MNNNPNTSSSLSGASKTPEKPQGRSKPCSSETSADTSLAGRVCEPKMLFRADTDQHGDWYVWRQLSENGWATMRRCESREDAQRLVDQLNHNPEQAFFQG